MRWSDKKCVVLDMDGTVYLGNVPIEGAVSFIRRRWTDLDFFFLSNNTSKSLDTYVKKLNGMGIPASKEIIITPIIPLVDFLQQNKFRRAYVVGNKDFCNELHQRMPELEQTDEKAQAVILAYDTELTYAKLACSALLLQRPEVMFLATHPDLVCPSPDGPLPDVGSMLNLYETSTGRRPQHIFGKPDPQILSPLLKRYAKNEMIMVGDRLSTDKKLAENAGIDFALVLSGEATRETLQLEVRKPTVVLEHLGQAEDIW